MYLYRKHYLEHPSSAAALGWRRVGAALPCCHGCALASAIPRYIPERPRPAPSMWLSQPDSVGRGWEGLHLHLNVGACVTRGLSVGSSHSREMGKISAFTFLLLLPISPPRVPGSLLPNLSPCITLLPGQLLVAFKGSWKGSGRHQRSGAYCFFLPGL